MASRIEFLLEWQVLRAKLGEVESRLGDEYSSISEWGKHDDLNVDGFIEYHWKNINILAKLKAELEKKIKRIESSLRLWSPEPTHEEICAMSLKETGPMPLD